MRDGFNVPVSWTLKLPAATFETVTYVSLPHICAGLLPNTHKLISLTIIFSAVSWKSYSGSAWNRHRQQQEGSCTCPYPCFCFFVFYWQPKHTRFHSFSGTFASLLPTALNNGALCACVHWREACARVCPLFIIERLAALPADPSLLCYLREDKGGRCEEEINVNPSVFN